MALAGRRRLAEVFDYRFEGGADLRDHSVGNIIIAALADMSGGFCEGVEQAARLLRIMGASPGGHGEPHARHPLPTERVTRGESAMREPGPAISGSGSSRRAPPPRRASPRPSRRRTSSSSPRAACSPARSRLSLGAGVPEALASFTGPVVYAANVMTQPGETAGFTVSDHLRAITDHVGTVVTDVLVPAEQLPRRALSRYRAQGAMPVEIDRDDIDRLGIRVREARLISEQTRQVRHDPDRLARAVRQLARARRSRRFARLAEGASAAFLASLSSQAALGEAVDVDVVERRHDEVGARGGQHLLVVGARQPERGHLARLGGLDAGHRVLDHEACPGGAPSSLAAVRKISGCGLPWAKSRPEMSASKKSSRLRPGVTKS